MSRNKKILIVLIVIVAIWWYAKKYRNKGISKTNTGEKMTDRNYTIADAEKGLRAIARKYGTDLAKVIEQMYRWETRHFDSLQFKKTGSPGMEAVPGSTAPNYGWSKSFFDANPEFKFLGVWEAFENKGMSEQGGNEQDTVNKKRFAIFPSVEAGMMFLADYILRYNGNYANWYSTNAERQQLYRDRITSVTPRIVNQIA